jgi:hypothetical protein
MREDKKASQRSTPAPDNKPQLEPTPQAATQAKRKSYKLKLETIKLTEPKTETLILTDIQDTKIEGKK